MRIVVAIVAAMSLAAVYQPAVAQAPGGYPSSSLMPMPQVAQYSAPSAGTSQFPTYQHATPVPQYQRYQPAIPAYQPRGYGQTGNGWSAPRYQPNATPPRANYNYANYAGPPQPQAQPTPSPNGGPVPANGSNPWLDSMSAPWGSREGGAGAAPVQPGSGSGYAAGSGYGCDPAYGAGYGPAYGAGYGPAYGGGYGPAYGGGYGPAYGEGYGGAYGTGVPFCPHWKVDLAGMYMGRLDSNPVWFSYVDGNLRDQLGNGIGNDAFGAQLGLTRRFCCGAGTFGVQGLYWGLFPSDWTFEQRDTVGDVMSVYNFYPLDVPGNARDVDGYFDNARYHRVQRNWEVHNAEINFLGGSLLGDGVDGWGLGAAGGSCGGGMCGTGCGGMGYCQAGCAPASCGPRLNVGWLVGVRFLYFGDSLQWATDQADYQLSWDHDEQYYDIDVDNHLIGAQLGFAGDWAMTPRLHLRTSTKFGVFGNHITHVSQIHGELGDAYVNDPGGPNDGMEFDIHSNETAVSFLGELEIGLACHFTRRLVGTVGYRVVAVTGVAIADAQIPRNFGGIQDVADIDGKNELILHGLQAGIEFCW